MPAMCSTKEDQPKPEEPQEEDYSCRSEPCTPESSVDVKLLLQSTLDTVNTLQASNITHAIF